MTANENDWQPVILKQYAIKNIKTLMETMNWNHLQVMNALQIADVEHAKYLQLLKQ